ncbi:MAG: hypothetical protein KJO79_00060 [Verrucomicrobiae bacterium]|nr:hypothetical protein [Verrucomicrobiae bacterium]NNJ85538.1 hypothetical protein [Akkermansiaceae bacterium]
MCRFGADYGLLSYLKITALKVGLLLNFKHVSLKIKRITNTH